VFFLRSEEQIPCPGCGSKLNVAGSRPRKYIRDDGERRTLIIRRLRCSNSGCRKIHHELPDFLVPYKRFSRYCIESALSQPHVKLDIPADNATLHRWRLWFYGLADYLYGCLLSIAIQASGESVKGCSGLSLSPLQKIQSRVGDGAEWLARCVRSVVNSNNWPQTRFAFLS
jgi:hypothetical protein